METQVKQHSFPDCNLARWNIVWYDVNVGSVNRTSMRKTIIPDPKEKMEKRNYCQMEVVCQGLRFFNEVHEATTTSILTESPGKGVIR